MQVNFSTLSFKSNYKMPLNGKTSEAIGPLYEHECNGIEIYQNFDSKIQPTGDFGTIILDADDEFDEKIEALLKSRGVKFHKTSKEELMELDNIFSRIKLAEEDEARGKHLVTLDTKKVEELFKKENTYIGPNGEKGIGRRYEQFIDYLKSGRDIDASHIHIREENGNVSLGFLDGRHRFCVLRDMQMPKIPFAMDMKSLCAARRLGLVAK